MVHVPSTCIPKHLIDNSSFKSCYFFWDKHKYIVLKMLCACMLCVFMLTVKFEHPIFASRITLLLNDKHDNSLSDLH